MIKSEYPIQPVQIGLGDTGIAGVLQLPPGPHGIVLLTAGLLAREPAPHFHHLDHELRRAGLATLRLDPPAPDQERKGQDIADLARMGARLDRASAWLAAEPVTKNLALGLFGTGCASAAALQFAARRPDRVAAVVSRDGRPDLAGPHMLARVRAPTLLLVDEQDAVVVGHNRRALALLSGEKDLAMIRDAGNRIGQPEPLQEVARLAARWFTGYLRTDTDRRP